LTIVEGGRDKKKSKSDKIMTFLMNLVVLGHGGAAQAHRLSLVKDTNRFPDKFKANDSWIAYGSHWLASGL
jgi:hypothetical protein